MAENYNNAHPPGILNRIVNFVGDAIILFALFIIPLALHPDVYHPYMTPKFLALGWLMLPLMAILALHIFLGKRAEKPASPLFLFALCLWLLINIISSIYAQNPTLAMEQTAFPAASAVFAWWAYRRAGSIRLLSAISNVLAAAVVINALYGFAQYWQYDFLVLEEPGKPVGFIGNTNMTAQFLIAVLPLVAVFTLQGSMRTLNGAALLFGVLQILLLKSRGGIIGFCAGFFFMICAWHYISARKKNGAAISLIRFDRKTVLVLILGIFITSGTFLILDHGQIINEMMSSFSTSPESNRYRILAWKASLRLAARQPLIGVGPGHYRFYHPLYVDAEFWKLNDAFGRLRLLQAHNDYINILCETGAAGLLAYLAICFLLARGFVRMMKNDGMSDETKFRIAAIAACLFSTSVQSFVDFNLYNPVSGFLFWLTAGLLAGAHLREDGEKTPPLITRMTVSIILLIFLAGLLLAGAPRLKSVWRNEKILRNAETAFAAGKYDESAHWAAAVLDDDPISIDAAAFQADALRNIPGRETEAVRAYLQWAELEPNYVPIFNRLGQSYFNMGRLVEAKESFERALSINPCSVPDLLNLGNMALGDKKYEEAVQYYQRAAEVGGDLLKQNEAQFGIALYMTGRHREAIPRLVAGVAFMPEKSAALLELLGDSYAAIGAGEEAADAWRMALILGAPATVRQKRDGIKKELTSKEKAAKTQ
ncbi:MAG TPA: tetratricopeptide repeat protein [Candidatus Sumerlaeota bacterium]|nr:tetratricopeptide repeat protein [Candidatus Sumerlaeota bacterium]HON50550.1 tetratricopeptide repeat protein [Candidatus Sumerlaeota bacterium]HOR65372.1 tetratricopeptide repeat protein [Candidatus Sumerlaeota bacterium]HPL74810.1 tetratricopeptide repeat protein [Candidatus Sumerlaeota bacterium]HRU55107.1 tetratricopeptide repeat protein [Candidatus Sumerlaeia bacterium]